MNMGKDIYAEGEGNLVHIIKEYMTKQGLGGQKGEFKGGGIKKNRHKVVFRLLNTIDRTLSAKYTVLSQF